MKCKDLKEKHTKLVTTAFKLVKQGEWIGKRIQEKIQEEDFDLAEKLSLDSVEANNRLRGVRVEISELENTYGFLQVKI